MTLSTSKASVGTPSQYAQSSRKGKKAWRKNIDIREVESGLEEIRAEEISSQVDRVGERMTEHDERVQMLRQRTLGL